MLIPCRELTLLVFALHHPGHAPVTESSFVPRPPAMISRTMTGSRSPTIDPGAAEPLTVVPIRLVRSYVIVSLVINDGTARNFLFDSGAASSLLDAPVAAELGVRTTGSATNSGAGGQTQVVLSAGNRIAIGDVRIDNATFAVMPIGPISTALGLPIAGIIGHEILSRYVTTHNLDALTMTLHVPGTFVPAAESTAVPITLMPNGLIITDVTVTTRDGHTRKLPSVIDSGSGRYFGVYANGIAAHNLIDSTRTYPVVTERGVDNRPMRNYLDTLPVIRMGSFEHTQVPTVLAVDAPNPVSQPGLEVHGLIGQGMLLRYNVTYDYGNRRMLLTPRTGGQ